MTDANNNGHHAAVTRMDELIDTVTTQGQSIGNLISDLIDESSRRRLVIRNLDDAVVLEVPLNGVIIGSVILTAMMRLRWVVVLSLLTLFGRFYVTIEHVDALTEDDHTEEQAVEAPAKRSRRRTSKSQRSEA